MRRIFRNIRERKGTTLVEMLIAFSVFGILIAITVSNFRQSLELQQLSALLLESHDNASFLFEQIAREVRTSSDIIATGPSSIEFMHQDGYLVSYAYNAADGIIYRQQGVNAPVPATTANSRMQIENFSVDVLNPGTEYRRLTMSVQIRVLDKRGNPFDTTLQTTVSPRFYE